MKAVYIAEKPSVARTFAQALKLKTSNKDGYMESEEAIITWCVGHLVSMSYPEVYDAKYKRWSLDTIPFIPDEFKYEVIENVKKQFRIVSGLLNRTDVDTIYICTDSGREGEYIYRLVDMMAQVNGKAKKRVWIDSQTEEEILRGIREAKDDAEYDPLSSAAFLRAKEDYLMGINFSRALTLKYGYSIKDYLNIDKCVISIGRVMTCVLGIVVDREREIRNFTKTPFYRVMSKLSIGMTPHQSASQTASFPGSLTTTGRQDAPVESPPDSRPQGEGMVINAEWRAVKGSAYFESPKLYKENGFKERVDAEVLIKALGDDEGLTEGQVQLSGDTSSGSRTSQSDATPDSVPDPTVRPVGIVTVEKIEKKKESKNAPLLYNLAELQNDCSKFFKITPEQTLNAAQELYEKKLTTYPRTDARVLSTAIAKEIKKNIEGLTAYDPCAIYARSVLQHEAYKGIVKTRYVNDKAITDHYAIIPTGQGLGALSSCNPTIQKVYEIIVRRFLAVFFPAAQYQKIGLTVSMPRRDDFENSPADSAIHSDTKKNETKKTITDAEESPGSWRNDGHEDRKEYFFASFKILTAKGYTHVMEYSFFKNKQKDDDDGSQPNAQSARKGDGTGEQSDDVNATGLEDTEKDGAEEKEEVVTSEAFFESIGKLKKGDTIPVQSLYIKEGETSPPKRYSSGTLILTMENAGQFIEDEDLRAQIKGSGIGTSATRAGILDKLVKNGYLAINRKTQIVTPTQMGEMIYETVLCSMKPMLNPALTASWEKGLTMVADGKLSEAEYMVKLDDFIRRRTDAAKQSDYRNLLRQRFDYVAQFYKEKAGAAKKKSAGKTTTGKGRKRANK